MTHLSQDLNKICRNWCPIVDMCPSDHYCKEMRGIRQLIIKITESEGTESHED